MESPVRVNASSTLNDTLVSLARVNSVMVSLLFPMMKLQGYADMNFGTGLAHYLAGVGDPT
jgi:hypothetical protein